MRRKSLHRLWTFILMLVLCGGSLVPTARVARATSEIPDPTNPTGSGGYPTAGDPDDPNNGKSPKSGGSHIAVGNPAPQMQSGWSMWMLRFRMAFAATYRFLFRF
jgi:hypothetical protein